MLGGETEESCEDQQHQQEPHGSLQWEVRERERCCLAWRQPPTERERQPASGGLGLGPAVTTILLVSSILFTLILLIINNTYTYIIYTGTQEDKIINKQIK